MSLPEQPSPLTSRLTALAQRVGLLGRGCKPIFERASQLRLPFAAIPTFADNLCWLDGPPLQRLKDLPRSALSGPVQEDKAEAHAALTGLIEVEHRQVEKLDLREVDSLVHCDDRHASFEDYATSEACRQIRIISYRDFVKVLSQALPDFPDQRLELYQAQWRGERLFWAGEQHPEAFASAVAYARLRGLEISLSADITHYRVSANGLRELEQHYHALAMPCAAWSDAGFMQLLMDHDIPYARLSLLRTPDSPEFLLLPKHSPQASALGEGLCQAGAPDMLRYIRELD
ncbi:hypothetical protein DNK06_06030 [Pseudomonas daroniae]|uniref:Uncharacterized protein n=1 Tax=Phytopseudomonas daroniae TaxID=2487519 RepID=A0A4Q9QQN6_9GAMM|nr:MULTISPECIES: DUF6685 family protein [Pseudomonas]TBU82072.1 hypothetical protein DNK06_06030 [Pseudomonas daroniae]TBU84592.1 hypothetical protein DNK31_06485 [Pseudomonas sp. FRB 228]TBU92373.1 hypothetical protein DNJ99_08175 [Pseudomonas daroniae]